MKLQEAKENLDKFLVELLFPLGFRKTNLLDYEIALDNATGFLSFPCRANSKGHAAFNCIIAIRINSIAEWLDKKDNDKRSVFVTGIHHLRANKEFAEWEFVTTNDLNALRNQIFHDIHNLAIPFIMNYSNAAKARKLVESNDPKDWGIIGLNIDSRINVLAVMQLVDGDKLGAIKTLDDALAARKGTLPKRWFDIDRLRKRIVASGSKTPTK